MPSVPDSTVIQNKAPIWRFHIHLQLGLPFSCSTCSWKCLALGLPAMVRQPAVEAKGELLANASQTLLYANPLAYNLVTLLKMCKTYLNVIIQII